MRGAGGVGGTIGAVTETANRPAAAAEPLDETTAEPLDETTAEPLDETTAAAAGGPAETTTGQPVAETAEPAAEEPAAETAAEPLDETTAAAAGGPAEATTGQPVAETAEPAAENPAAETAAGPAAENPEAETVVEPAAENPAEATAAGSHADGQIASERGSGIGTPIPSAATTGGLNSGDIVSGVVRAVDRREVELDLGSGRVGVVGSRHWTAGLDVDLTGEVQVGDTVEAAVLVREDHKQRIVLSRSWGRQQRAWELAETARKTGDIISGTVTDAVAAGLTVDIGIRAFVPASMAGDDDLEALVDSEVECKVTEVNQLKGRCILSRKAALRTRERQAARKRLAELSPGTKVRARVTKVEDFGALVLAEGNLRGRIRRGELSWFRVRRPGDVVAVGDEVEAVVLHTAPAKLNLDLSLRIGEDPLKTMSPGERHEATVVSLAPFGAFVTVGDGIKGLVPTAELAEHPIRHPREVVVPGDSVLAEVTKVDRQRRDLEFSVNLAVLVRPSDQA